MRLIRRTAILVLVACAVVSTLKQPEALWTQPIPAAQRASRRQLINIANA